MMTELANIQTDWEALRFNDRKAAFGREWHGFQRRTLAEAWDLGRGLRSIKDEAARKEWTQYLAEIGMGRRWAYQLMPLADGYTHDEIVCSDCTIDDAVAALPPKRPKKSVTVTADPDTDDAESIKGDWSAEISSTVYIRRSDDSLKYQCKTEDGREAVGSIPSTIGAKIVASAVFIDLGITDAITDKHREYPASFVIPVTARTGNGEKSGSSAGLSSADEVSEGKDIYTKLQEFDDLRKKGLLTDAEFDSEKKKLLEGD